MSQNCHHTQAFLVDETAPRPADLEAHLATCARCSDFKRAHQAALAMRGVTPGLTTRPPVERIRRRAGIIAGLALIVSSATGLVLQLPEVTEATPRLESPPLRVAAAIGDEEAEWRALTTLNHAVVSTSQSDPTRDDLTYRAFGDLPAWLAPETTRPLHALGRALSPVVLTREY